MNRVVLRTAALTLTVAAVLPFAAPAAADTRECFFIGADFVCVNVAPGGEVTPFGGGPGSPLGTWSTFPYDVGETQPLSCFDAQGNPVVAWVLVFYPNDPAQPPVSTNYCQEPALPPPPPTPEEAWRGAPIPAPAVNINPGEEGATGIESWLWGAPAAAVPVSVSVRGYTVSGVAGAAEWRWNMGATEGTANPAPDLEASRPGSPEAPAARYVYETKGAYSVTHRVVWSGSFTVTGWGLDGLVLDAGIIVVESTRPYTVIEIRSVRQTPGDS